jgi:hypothetical protein
MIEPVGLQIGAGRLDIGQRRLAQDVGDDVLNRAIRDLMDKADVPVFAGRDTRDDLAPDDFFRADDGLAARAGRNRHHDEYGMLAIWPHWGNWNRTRLVFRKIRKNPD